MSAIAVELDQFTRFVREKLADDATELSLEDCLREWRAAQEEEETIAAIQRGLDDIAAGRVLTLAEADQRVRAELTRRWKDR